MQALTSRRSLIRLDQSSLEGRFTNLIKLEIRGQAVCQLSRLHHTNLAQVTPETTGNMMQLTQAGTGQRYARLFN